MRIAVVTHLMKSGARGGAEAFYEGLVGGLRAAGHAVDQIEVAIDESSFEGILEAYQACYDLDLDDYDLVISTKSPTYMVRHRQHLSYLVHTMRVFYDMFEHEYRAPTPDQCRQRDLIRELDKYALHPDRVRRHLTIGHTNYKRLLDTDSSWEHINYEVLHLPPTLTGFKDPRPGEYIFLPGRLHRWKRVHLVVEATRHLRRDVPLLIAGTGEDEPNLRALAANDPRIRFLGQVTDAQLVDLYAGALVVPFVPRDEDYGLVAIEAFKSKKPVITCSDSGEPTYFVRDGETGFVVPPDPAVLAEKLDYLVGHPDLAAEMGLRGSAAVSHLTWESIAATLLSSVDPAARPTSPSAAGGSTVRAEPDRREAYLPRTPVVSGHSSAGPVRVGVPRAGDVPPERAPHRVAVLDMQPIDPPVGGGRIRLLGLYHALGRDLPTTYVGSYDWPGPPARRHRLSPTLEEIDVPLTAEHFQVAEQWRAFAGERPVVDVAFPLMARHSQDFEEKARAAAREADIVVFSHPWIFPSVRDVLDDERQLIVYDAQNFEGLLRAELLDDGGFGTEVVKHVVLTERELAHRADLVLTCSHEDARLFAEVYGVEEQKLRTVPNGVFVNVLRPPTIDEKRSARTALGLERRCAIFLGSRYAPNVAAIEFIRSRLARSLPDVSFLVCGGVAEAFLHDQRGVVPSNLHLYPSLTEEEKLQLLWGADVAINPVFNGSGTNIKMFEFMAVGLPIVSTTVGARGISSDGDVPIVVADASAFSAALERLVHDEPSARQLGSDARRFVERHFSWERVSPQLGHTLVEAHQAKRRRRESVRSDESRRPRAGRERTPSAVDQDQPPRPPLLEDGHPMSVRRRMAMLTTWSASCGIAEHAKHLVDALEPHRVDCWIVGGDGNVESCVPAERAGASIAMDDLWRYQHIGLDAIIASCCRADVEVLNVQYHTGFFGENLLLPLAHTCLSAGIRVLIALHDPKNVSDHTLVDLSRIGVRLVVHNEAEQRRFRSVGVEDIAYVPLGVLEVPDEDVASARERLTLAGGPVIGTFGFLRPHKGLLELIEAGALLRGLYPDLVLYALASAHPSKEAQQYQRTCEARIAELGLQEHVLLDTRFRDIEQVVRDLHACDAIVLPYHASKEGASASANVALAARRPVITSRAEIFQSTRRATYQVEGIAPPTLAAGVATALASPLLLSSLKAQSERHVASTSWATVAGSVAQLGFPVNEPGAVIVRAASAAGSWAGDGPHRDGVDGRTTPKVALG